MGETVVFEEVGLLDVIEAAAAQRLQRKREAGGVDDVDADAEAGAQAQRRARILGKIGLVEGKFECDLSLRAVRCRVWRWV